LRNVLNSLAAGILLAGVVTLPVLLPNPVLAQGNPGYFIPPGANSAAPAQRPAQPARPTQQRSAPAPQQRAVPQQQMQPSAQAAETRRDARQHRCPAGGAGDR
jgi:hypothetical protein